MKPLIYVTKNLPNALVLELQEKFQLSIWEEEDFAILEQAVEQADIDHGVTSHFEA